MLGALFPVVLVLHAIVTVGLIGIILTQKNEGGMGGLGGGAAGGMAGFLSGRAQANLITKATRWLAVGFFCTSLFLAFADAHRTKGTPLVGAGEPSTSEPAAPSGGTDSDTVPATPAEPAAPIQPAAPSGQ